MHKRVKPTSRHLQHGYEMTFSIENPTPMGVRHVVDGRGRFIGNTYDNGELETACNKLAQAAPTDALHQSQADRLRRFVGRAEKLLDRRMAKPGFVFPSLRMSEGAFNTEEIQDQIGEEWDAVLHRLRPFINKDLFGETIINDVLAGWRQHPEIDAIKQVICRYYLLEDAARHRDLYIYRRDDLVMVAWIFKDGRFEASGARGSFQHLYCFSKNQSQDGPEDRQRLQDFIKDPSAGAFFGGFPYAYGVCRVMNDRFCDEWLQKIEYHDIPKENAFFASYLDVDVVEWFVRYHLAYGLTDRIVVLSWLSDLARKLV